MHSVALTASHEVYSTGVNDEAALGRFTGWCSSLLVCLVAFQPGARLICGVIAAASEAWKGHEGSEEAGDSYTWGKVDMPATHGHAVQVSAGRLARPPAYRLDLAFFHAAGLSTHLTQLALQGHVTDCQSMPTAWQCMSKHTCAYFESHGSDVLCIDADILKLHPKVHGA